MACKLAVNLENQTQAFLIKDSNYQSEKKKILQKPVSSRK